MRKISLLQQEFYLGIILMLTFGLTKEVLMKCKIFVKDFQKN